MKEIIILTVAIIAIISFYYVWKFWKYKRLEKKYKNEISTYLSDGIPLSKAVEAVFTDLNERKSLGLDNSTIKEVSEELVELTNVTDTENVVELYSTFVYNFILDIEDRYEGGANQRVLFAIRNLELQNHGGYLTIDPKTTDKLLRKFG